MLFITGDIHGTIDIGKVIQYFENESIKKKIRIKQNGCNGLKQKLA